MLRQKPKASEMNYSANAAALSQKLSVLVIAIMVIAGVSRNFGSGVGTTLGLIFLPVIFYPRLGFGSARNLGATAQ